MANGLRATRQVCRPLPVPDWSVATALPGPTLSSATKAIRDEGQM